MALKKKVKWVNNIVKLLFTMILILYVALQTNHQRRYLLVGYLSLFWITALSWLLMYKHKHLGRILNNIGSTVLNAQYMVFLLGGTFTSMDMLTSLHTVGALKGTNTVVYVCGVILVLLFSFIPIYEIHISKALERITVIGAIAGNVALANLIGPTYSAIWNVGKLSKTAYDQHMMNRNIEVMAQELDKEDVTYKKVEDHGYKYPKVEKPNVLLVFTEGFSQSIVDDPRDLMPNVRYYENNESLNFINYYNHTSATYRGIPCQLHSGFQFEDMDDNYLVSLQNVFDKYGYDTTLINPEPYQTDFAEHMGRFGFDHYIDGLGQSEDAVTDKQMYEEAFKLLDEKKDKPKLVTMYTFNTHVGQDSKDKMYGDGTDKVLNRFNNMDYQFGEFMKKLKSSGIADNTLVILTTDHASYVDADYKQAFPDNGRVHPFISTIPMLYWYKGVKPEQIDCQNRTSLDMAPTVLDFLNMEQPSDFLGTSLFAKKPSSGYQRLVETSYVQPVPNEFYTVDGGIKPLEGDNLNYMKQIVMNYCAKAKVKRDN